MWNNSPIYINFDESYQISNGKKVFWKLCFDHNVITDFLG